MIGDHMLSKRFVELDAKFHFLKKGAHVQVEGEIRHTEYTPKKAKKPVRSDSVRVTSILKLDRAEKAAPEDLEHEPEPSDDIPF